eukprot:scaffold100019_cov80-Phaeocystis_antarctica.AAC.5
MGLGSRGSARDRVGRQGHSWERVWPHRHVATHGAQPAQRVLLDIRGGHRDQHIDSGALSHEARARESKVACTATATHERRVKGSRGAVCTCNGAIAARAAAAAAAKASAVAPSAMPTPHRRAHRMPKSVRRGGSGGASGGAPVTPAGAEEQPTRRACLPSRARSAHARAAGSMATSPKANTSKGSSSAASVTSIASAAAVTPAAASAAASVPRSAEAPRTPSSWQQASSTAAAVSAWATDATATKGRVLELLPG